MGKLQANFEAKALIGISDQALDLHGSVAAEYLVQDSTIMSTIAVCDDTILPRSLLPISGLAKARLLPPPLTQSVV